MNLTKGLGLEQNTILVKQPDESIGEIVNYIQGSNMVLLQLEWVEEPGQVLHM